MNRSQRKTHPWLWLLVGIAGLAILVYGVTVRPPVGTNAGVAETDSEAAP